MEKATSNVVNARYNDEVLFLDGIIESHPEAYDALSAGDRELLNIYYLIGMPVPENIFEYRRALLLQQPGIEVKAKAVFGKVLELLNIDVFTYTTEPRIYHCKNLNPKHSLCERLCLGPHAILYFPQKCSVELSLLP